MPCDKPAGIDGLGRASERRFGPSPGANATIASPGRYECRPAGKFRHGFPRTPSGFAQQPAITHLRDRAQNDSDFR